MNIREYYENKLEKLEHIDVRKEERVTRDETREIKNIYIIGICGTAMGSLAGLLRQAGYEVFGYDEGAYPPISTMLKDIRITIDTNCDAKTQKKIQSSDIVVVGNAIGPMHEVVEYARSIHKPLVSLPEVLDTCVFKKRKRIVIAGTHGKTTTTGIVTSIFNEAEKVGEIVNPGYLIGGVMQGKTTGFDLGTVANEGYFIIEGDEYDTSYFDKRPKFLTYEGDGGIITSIELDHLDIYTDLKDYEKAFQFFIESLPKEGTTLIANHPDVSRVADRALQDQGGVKQATHILTYAVREEDIKENSEEIADVYLRDIVQENGTQKGSFVYKGKNVGEIQTKMSGRHNLMNVAGAAGLAYSYGISFDSIAKGIKNFSGMKRRQEVVYDGYATLIDDFAHHPTAVEETIAGIKKLYQGRRLIVLFEPRSNSSRRKIFQDPYIAALKDVECVIIKQPAVRHNDIADNYIDVKQMVKDLTREGANHPSENMQEISKAYSTADTQETIDVVEKNLKKDDVILMMSNGSLDGIRESLNVLLLQYEKTQ